MAVANTNPRTKNIKVEHSSTMLFTSNDSYISSHSQHFGVGVKLDKKWRRVLLIVRLLAFSILLILGTYAAYRIFFPQASFYFSFRTAGSLKNTLVSPREKNDSLTLDGAVKNGSTLAFDAPLNGDYSDLKIKFVLENDSEKIENATISFKKSYQAFFYPQGEPMGFKNGSLLRNGDNFFIISENKWRKFESPSSTIKNLGYNPEAFREISTEELRYNEEGRNLPENSDYPDGAIFKVDDEYYQLNGGTFFKFVSTRAYLANYRENQAIIADSDFLGKHPLSEEFLGFPDGTLLSEPGSGYIISSQKRLPINSEKTFVSMGFDWTDMEEVSGEELGIYPKTKLFSLASPHPDGFVFFAEDTGKYYYIFGGKKHWIPTQNILADYFNETPIKVNEGQLGTRNQCRLKKRLGLSPSYQCSVSIENLRPYIGNDYQFELSARKQVKIKEINIIFKRKLNWDNFHLAITEIKQRIKDNYGIK